MDFTIDLKRKIHRNNLDLIIIEDNEKEIKGFITNEKCKMFFTLLKSKRLFTRNFNNLKNLFKIYESLFS